MREPQGRRMNDKETQACKYCKHYAPSWPERKWGLCFRDPPEIEREPNDQAGLALIPVLRESDHCSGFERVRR